MNYDQPIFQSKENRLQLEMASWVYQSHLWKRDDILREVIKCEWCGIRLGGSMSITAEDSICTENPKIREMRLLWTKTIIKGIEDAEIMIKKSRTSPPSTETFMSGGIGYGKTIEKKR